jgi:PII-like signaling protein
VRRASSNSLTSLERLAASRRFCRRGLSPFRRQGNAALFFDLLVVSLFVCLRPVLFVYSCGWVSTAKMQVPYSASNIIGCGVRSIARPVLVKPVGQLLTQVTIYSRSEQWHHRPLLMQDLNHLGGENLFARLHAGAGYLGRRVDTAHPVDVTAMLPVVITFVNSDEHVNPVPPSLEKMAGQRLIVSKNVALEQDALH